MRILILGSGAREHAIAWKLKSEIGSENIYISPGNAGTQMCGTNANIGVSDFESLTPFAIASSEPGKIVSILFSIQYDFSDSKSETPILYRK